MRLITLITLATLAFCAQEPNQNIGNVKSKAIQSIEKEIQILKDAKECVNKASNKAEFEACKEKTKIDLQAARSSK